MKKVLILSAVIVLLVSCIINIPPGTINQVDTLLDDQFVVSLAIGEDGTAWAGIIRDQYGLVKINPDGSTEIFDHTNSCLKDSANILDIDFDSEGNLWMLNDGLVCYDGSTFTRIDSVEDNYKLVSIWSKMMIDDNDNIWVTAFDTSQDGSSLGIYSYNGEAFQKHEPTSLNSHSYIRITDIENDNSNNIWFSINGYHSQVVFLKYDGNNWTDYDTSDIGYNPYNITNIDFDSDDNLWFNDDFLFSSIAYHGQAALFMYDKRNEAIPVAGNEYISAICIDENDRVWASGFLPNLSVFDNGKWVSLNNDEAIPLCREMKFDENDDLWYVSSTGIMIYRYFQVK